MEAWLVLTSQMMIEPSLEPEANIAEKRFIRIIKHHNLNVANWKKVTYKD